MAIFAAALPVLSGKEAMLRQFAKDMQAKKKEFEKSEKRNGIKRESWHLQSSPQGSWILVHFEAKDVNWAVANFGKSTDPFDVWFKDTVGQITGINMSMAPSGALPELLISYGY